MANKIQDFFKQVISENQANLQQKNLDKNSKNIESNEENKDFLYTSLKQDFINSMLETREKVSGFWVLKGSDFVSVGNKNHKRIIGVDKENILEIEKFRTSARKFYDLCDCQKNPLLPNDIIDKNGKLIFKKGLSFHVTNVCLNAFDPDYLPFIRKWEDGIESFAKEGIIANGGSFLVEMYDKQLKNNGAHLFTLKNDISSKNINFKNLCKQTNYFIFGMENDNKISETDIAKIKNLTPQDILKNLQTYDKNYFSYEDFIFQATSLSVIVDTRNEEFLEYLGKDSKTSIDINENFAHDMYTFGVPARFVVGVVLNKYAMASDYFSSKIYESFKDRYIFDSFGEVLNNPLQPINKQKFQEKCYQNIEIIKEDNLQF